MAIDFKKRSNLPGFGLSLGITVLYLSLMVLLPISMIFIKTATVGWSDFWTTVTAPRVLASYRLSLGASFIAAVAARVASSAAERSGSLGPAVRRPVPRGPAPSHAAAAARESGAGVVPA